MALALIVPLVLMFVLPPIREEPWIVPELTMGLLKVLFVRVSTPASVTTTPEVG